MKLKLDDKKFQVIFCWYYYFWSWFLLTFLGGSCTQELQALFGCLKKWEFDDIPCAKLHTEYMRCVESAEAAATAFKEGAKKGILGEGTSKLSTAQFNKIMAMFPQPDLGVSQRRMKRLPHISYASDVYRRKDKNKPN